MWSKKTGKKTRIIKMIDLTKTHCGISAMAFSLKYRVSLLPPPRPRTNDDFLFAAVSDCND
jgi:hypothetical protein